tara:strand:+ start:42 stop:260 length:219 start_codon:yes stop_codon:yes gene_type:complete
MRFKIFNFIDKKNPDPIVWNEKQVKEWCLQDDNQDFLYNLGLDWEDCKKCIVSTAEVLGLEIEQITDTFQDD